MAWEPPPTAGSVTLPLMTSNTSLTCDHCGKVTDYTEDGVRGWLRIHDRVYYTAYLRGSKDELQADLCSWQCMRAYATVQARS